MKVTGRLVLIILASFVGATAGAAEFDGSETLMCSFARVVECDLGADCRNMTNESVDAPDFVKLDFKRKKVVAISAGVESEPDDIDNIIDLANYIVLQGVQGGAEGAADSLAWSVTINHNTGQIVLAAAGENAGFVVFGACTAI
jgi:hypothetical protein